MIDRLLQRAREKRFAQNHPPKSRQTDPFATRRVATRPSRSQVVWWRGRYG